MVLATKWIPKRELEAAEARPPPTCTWKNSLEAVTTDEVVGLVLTHSTLLLVASSLATQPDKVAISGRRGAISPPRLLATTQLWPLRPFIAHTSLTS